MASGDEETNIETGVAKYSHVGAIQGCGRSDTSHAGDNRIQLTCSPTLHEGHFLLPYGAGIKPYCQTMEWHVWDSLTRVTIRRCALSQPFADVSASKALMHACNIERLHTHGDGGATTPSDARVTVSYSDHHAGVRTMHAQVPTHASDAPRRRVACGA